MSVFDVPSDPTNTPLGSAGDAVPARTHSQLLAALGAAIVAIEAGYVTQADIDAAIAALVDSSPATLDTLNELAAALGDDANFAATVTTALAGKQPLDTDLTNIAALATQPLGRSLLTAADHAALVTILALTQSDVSGLVAALAAKTAKGDILGQGIITTAPFATPTGFLNPIGGSTNRTSHFRVHGSGAITKVAIQVGTQNGNICIAVGRGAVGATGPTSRLITTGSVACPAPGYNEIALGGSVTIDGTTDWISIGTDSATMTLLTCGSLTPNTSNIADGLSYLEIAFPTADPPTLVSRVMAVPILRGVA